VHGISERIQLYRELDEMSSDEELSNFKEHLADRFGPLPPQTEDLLRTIHLRETAKQVGFEKVILKSGKMIGYFVSRQDSPYYQSPKFSAVLEYMKKHPKKGKMYEKNGGLRMSFAHGESVEEAIAILEAIQKSVQVTA
jgi:transcription-repair coupling factor (superfamily II helicase)